MAYVVQVDLSTVPAWDATRGPINNPDPGCYQVKILSFGQRGAALESVVLSKDVGTFSIFQGGDLTKDSNKSKLRTTILSAGAKAAGIDAAGANFTFSDTMIVGKMAWVLVTAVEGVDDKGRPRLNECAFVTPEQAKAYLASNKSAKATPGAGPAPSAAPAPVAATGGVTPVDDLFTIQ